MNRTRLSAVCIASLLFGGTLSLLAQTPSAGIEQQLRSQYRIASVGNNGVVVRAGTVVVVQLDGITALPAPGEYPCNSHKEGGRISHSAMCAINYSVSKDNQRPLQVGEKAYLTAIQVKPAEIMFKVQTCCGDANDAPFRSAVSFQFPKGYLDSMKLKDIEDAIGEVFGPDTDAPAPAQAPPQRRLKPGSGVQQTTQDCAPLPPAAGTQRTALVGLWEQPASGVQMQINPDGSYAFGVDTDQPNPGHYTANGDTLIITDTASGRSTTFSIRGDKLCVGSRLVWVEKEAAAPPPPAAASLTLPAVYTSAQSPADKLQLNADNTFSLQEGGQAYQGTFAANGNTLDLNISGGPKTTATLQGNNLTDGSGQVWVLRELSAGSGPAGPLLKNDDVIKMAKAGLDDAIIIAKIGSSQCQFDTSADALIQLKQSGASAAVLRAVVAAGK